MGETGQEEEVNKISPDPAWEPCSIKWAWSLPYLKQGDKASSPHQLSSSGCFERRNIQVHWISNIRNLWCPEQFSREAQLKDLRKQSVQMLQESGTDTVRADTRLGLGRTLGASATAYRTTRIHVLLSDNLWGRKKICGLVGWPLTAAQAITDSSPLSTHSYPISLILDYQFC